MCVVVAAKRRVLLPTACVAAGLYRVRRILARAASVVALAWLVEGAVYRDPACRLVYEPALLATVWAGGMKGWNLCGSSEDGQSSRPSRIEEGMEVWTSCRRRHPGLAGLSVGDQARIGMASTALMSQEGGGKRALDCSCLDWHLAGYDTHIHHPRRGRYERRRRCMGI